MRRTIPLAFLVTVLSVQAGAAEQPVTVVDRPDSSRPWAHYVANRPPLEPSPLAKLPIGAIEPRSWLRRQLELEADGFSGRLPELSRFVVAEGNAWLSPTGDGHRPWEEVPYWLKGYGDLGYVLGNRRIIEDMRKWIEAAFASQRFALLRARHSRSPRRRRAPQGFRRPRHSPLHLAGPPRHNRVGCLPVRETENHFRGRGLLV